MFILLYIKLAFDNILSIIYIFHQMGYVHPLVSQFIFIYTLVLLWEGQYICWKINQMYNTYIWKRTLLSFTFFIILSTIIIEWLRYINNRIFSVWILSSSCSTILNFNQKPIFNLCFLMYICSKQNIPKQNKTKSKVQNLQMVVVFDK